MIDINEQTKVPFYMISPMQKLYRMEMEYEKDMERMKALYPRQVQQLIPAIEDYCDGLEYEGSRIYDENPDAQMMRKECEKLIRKIKEDELSGADINAQQIQASDVVQVTEEAQAEAAAQAAEAKPRERAFSFTPPQGWELPQPMVCLDSGRAKPCIAAQQSTPQPGMSALQPESSTLQPGMSAPQPGMNTSQPAAFGDSWQDDLIGILFHNEIFRRRCRHRRCSRWW